VPERAAAVVTFAPGSLDTRKLIATLYEKDKIAVTAGGGQGRQGVRVSPHFYNTPEEVERLVRALNGYARTGV
jgi:selenocysteine lyase/cysteine desulfurase